MNIMEYRFIEMGEFSFPGLSRVGKYYKRAGAQEYMEPEQMILKPGQNCEYIVQHIEPGKDGDFSERHGPYTFWLYGKVNQNIPISANLKGNIENECIIESSQDLLQWHRLADFDLIGRMPQFKIHNKGQDEITCSIMLITNNMEFTPIGPRNMIENSIYGFNRTDLGHSFLEPDIMTVFKEYDVTATYECGPRDIVPGDTLILRHWGRYKSSLQNENPDGEFYLQSQFPEHTKWQVKIPTKEWRAGSREQWIECHLLEGVLLHGQKIVFTIKKFKADVVRGTPFFKNKPDHWYTPLSPLTIMIDAGSRGQPLPLHEKNSHRFKVVNDKPEALHVISQRDGSYQGHIIDHYNHVLEVAETESGDGIAIHEKKYGFSTTITPLNPKKNFCGHFPFWGDLHGHSMLSDGVGLTDQYYPYARQIAGLDFCALGEHICYITDIDLAYLAEMTAQYLEEGQFVTLFGFEWAGHGGHRCIYTDQEWMDPIRGMDQDTSTLSSVWKILDRSSARHFVSAHSILGMSAMHKYAEFHNQKYERYVEAYTRGGGSEYRDNPLLCSAVMLGQKGMSYRELLEQGVKVGFAGASDNHEATPGFTIKNWDRRRLGGLVGVWAENLTRQHIFNSLYARQCFATTGQKTSMWLEVNDVAMGSECKFSDRNRISFQVQATSPIDRLDVVRNGQEIYTITDQPAIIEKDFEDTTANEPIQYYYFRIIQKDGNWAWSSPVFQS